MDCCWDWDSINICENFITAETELVSAYNIYNILRIADVAAQYQHYNNFGAIRNADTLESIATTGPSYLAFFKYIIKPA